MQRLTSFLLLLCSCTLTLAQTDCPNPHDSNSDGAVNISDLLDLLGLFGDIDTDQDGIWDSVDGCTDLEACNYANEPSEPCAYLDVLRACGGGCEGDGDGDGICDDEDDCVGVVDECGVCNGPGPTEVVIEDIVITYDSVFLPLDNDWYVFPTSADTTFGYTCAPFFGGCGDPLEYKGYDYATVLIGEQCWFAENLRNENYANGDAIPSGLSASEWSSTTSGATAVYGEDEGDPAQSLNAYGRLYNGHAVDDARGLCPSGWHVPTDAEWTEMTDFLGGESVAGAEMKTTYGWNNGGNGTNSSGFSGLPGGGRFDDDGVFSSAGSIGWWWSSSPIYSTFWSRGLVGSNNNVNRDNDFYKRFGLSVRCVRDAE